MGDVPVPTVFASLRTEVISCQMRPSAGNLGREDRRREKALPLLQRCASTGDCRQLFYEGGKALSADHSGGAGIFHPVCSTYRCRRPGKRPAANTSLYGMKVSCIAIASEVAHRAFYE